MAGVIDSRAAQGRMSPAAIGCTDELGFSG